MKKLMKLVVAVVLMTLAGLGISQVVAQNENPSVATACENRNGAIHIIDDGFSRFVNCQGDNRRVVALGEPSWVPDMEVDVCFHVPNGSLRVMITDNCGSDVRWKIPVKCVDGAHCKPDNPIGPFD